MPAGILYVVATPIGNLEDITLRAIRVLKEVSLIAAEDTRHTQILLSRYDIHTPLTSYHEHNERTKAQPLVERLVRGESIALLSDAGTPANGRRTRKNSAGTESQSRFIHISERVRIVASSRVLTSSRHNPPACVPNTMCR